MKLVILGSSGMLGRYVTKYFSKNYDVLPLTRKDIDFGKSSKESIYEYFSSINLQPKDTIINCTGIIKPQISVVGEYESIFVNSALPHVIAKYCHERDLNFIHPTTDCIYSGEKGMYTEEDQTDVSDMYGLSKAMGESELATNIRVSIIGEELGQSRSLVEWVKSSKDKQVKGFTDHKWNGITCLEWAKLVESMLTDFSLWKGTVHAYCPEVVTKAELVKMISDVYDLNLDVVETTSNKACDRTLDSIKMHLIKKPLLEQLIEMRDFSLE
jgi:dTDP-4-dehydrorhamnose reductase